MLNKNQYQYLKQLTNKQKSRLMLKILEKSGSENWDYSTFNVSYPHLCKVYKTICLLSGYKLHKYHSKSFVFNPDKWIDVLYGIITMVK